MPEIVRKQLDHSKRLSTCHPTEGSSRISACMLLIDLHLVSLLPRPSVHHGDACQCAGLPRSNTIFGSEPCCYPGLGFSVIRGMPATTVAAKINDVHSTITTTSTTAKWLRVKTWYPVGEYPPDQVVVCWDVHLPLYRLVMTYRSYSPTMKQRGPPNLGSPEPSWSRVVGRR